MKHIGYWTKSCLGLLGVSLLLLLGAGCASDDPYSALNPKTPWEPGMAGDAPAAAPVSAAAPDAVTPGSGIPSSSTAATLRVGDLIKVVFSDVPNPPLPHEERVREDGNITLPYNVTVAAAGKSIGQVREEIHKAYVPKYFNHLTVTVGTTERVYYVGGQVKLPSRQPYIGYMSVLRAIDTAGGFNEFASRKNILLRRSTGEILKINYDKAIKDPSLDPEVFPGDSIYVERRIF